MCFSPMSRPRPYQLEVPKQKTVSRCGYLTFQRFAKLASLSSIVGFTTGVGLGAKAVGAHFS